MTETVTVGLIAASTAILSSMITGIISYKISVKADRLQNLAKKLRTSFQDISAFYQLESMYSEKVAEFENSTHEAVKRSYREKLRNEGFESPSRYSVPSYVNEELRKYEN